MVNAFTRPCDVVPWRNFSIPPMFGLPTSVLIGAGIVLTIWAATVVVAVVALRSKGRQAMVLAAVALAVSVAGMTTLSGRIGKKMTSTDVASDGTRNVRVSGWHLDSRWFFAASTAISAFALLAALRAKSAPVNSPAL